MVRSDSHSDSRRDRLRRRRVGALAALLAVTAGALVACGSDGGTGDGSGGPRIVVTTNILGDVVRRLVGEHATVEVIMPLGADPHDFQPSARQVAAIEDADVLVTNGAGFEAGLEDALDAAVAGGVPECVAVDFVATRPVTGERGSAADREEEPSDHGAVDPHFFTDPARMAAAAAGLADCVATAVPALDTGRFRRTADAEVERLRALDREVEEILSAVPVDRRVLVTNHDVFGYFAQRYGFDVAGTVIPSSSTQSEADARALDELARVLRRTGVPAVFAETSAPDALAQTLAREVGDVRVVTLFSESLGPDGGETYAAMMRTNATRIRDALGQ